MLPRVSFRSLLLLVISASLWISNPVTAQDTQDVTLRGFVTDVSTGQPLSGANVVLLDSTGRVRGAATNPDGFYRIADIAPGRYTLRISFVGYVSYTDTLRLGPQAYVRRSVALYPGEQRLDEVTVEAEDEAEMPEAGLQPIRPADIARIPTPGPGSDLAMYLQSLPGVVAPGDRGGQLFIRGGTPSQNLILLDGTPVYQPFHIVGFFSAFPQDLVAGVDFYAGGFPARYTGRLSSVIDVTTRSGNNRHFEGGASLGPFLAGARVEGPIVKGSMSFLASVRTSVIERTAPTIIGEELPLTFGDQFIKIQNAGETGRCSAAGLHTYDRGQIDLESDDVFTWSNYVVAGRCLTFAPTSPLTAEVKAGVSYFENTVGSTSDDPSTPDDERTASLWRLHTDADLTYQVGTLELIGGFRVGAGGQDFRLRELFQGLGTSDEEFTIKTGLHGGLKWSPDARFTLYPSVAFTTFSELSPSIEPRLRASWRPWGTEAHQLSAAAGLYRQPLVGLSDERDAGSVFTAWQFAPNANQRPEAWHALLGWQSDLGAGFDASIEGYYKRMTELLVPTWDTNARFTTSLGSATGTSYGFDARVQFQRAPFYLNLSYGYSWTRYGLRQENFSSIFGEPIQHYHPQHDRRHQLGVVASLERGAWQASTRWQYGSGLPYTAPEGFDAWLDLRALPDPRSELGQLRFLFDRPFGERLPAYHRLDLSVQRDFSFSFADLTLEAGAINLYDRSNVFYFDLFSLRRVDQLPLVPYVSLQLNTP